MAKREAYKARWHEWWNGEALDFMLTPVNATPAVPHRGMREAVSSCGYTFLFNLVGCRGKFQFGTSNTDNRGSLTIRAVLYPSLMSIGYSIDCRLRSCSKT